MFMSKNKNGGFALMELMLAIALLSVLTIALAPFLARSMDERRAKDDASQLTTFRASATAYMQANRSAYLAAMADGTGADELCLINVSSTGARPQSTFDETLHRCMIDASFLKSVYALPEGVSTINPYGESWVAIFKRQYAVDANDPTGPAVPTDNIEMLILSAKVGGIAGLVAPDERLYDRALTAAGYAGGNGGVVPDADRATCIASRAKAIYQVCGAGWVANLRDFLTPSELVAFSTRLQS